jgi:FkbM family methyltransferase
MGATTSNDGGFAALESRVQSNPFRQIDPAKPVWIFGAGSFAHDLARAMRARGIEVAGFVETVPGKTSALGLDVVDWKTLASREKQAQLVLGMFNHRHSFDKVVRIPVEAGFQVPLMPWELYEQFGDELGWRYWLGRRDVLTRNLARLARTAEGFADEISRQVLFRTCAFRLGLDLDYSSHLSEGSQYFNEITLPALAGRSIVYLDCGAYNGDTYIDLQSRPDVRCSQAFLLEPDPANFSELVSRVSTLHSSAICLPLAAAETYSILTFSSDGTSSAIGANGDVHIAAVAVDELLPGGTVDLIKIDVEGAEAGVLRGARQTILRNRPVLAVSLYHNPQDLWELPELLSDLCRDYRLYVRQHCFNSFDLVLYAVPEWR